LDDIFDVQNKDLGQYIMKWMEQSDIIVNNKEKISLSKLGAVTKHQFMTYVGLELAMSIHPLSEIRDYWSASHSLVFLNLGQYCCIGNFK
jgi:hypothetical protein